MVWSQVRVLAGADLRRTNRLGQIFRMEKKQVVVVAKYVEDPKLNSSSYPLLPGLFRPN